MGWLSSSGSIHIIATMNPACLDCFALLIMQGQLRGKVLGTSASWSFKNYTSLWVCNKICAICIL